MDDDAADGASLVRQEAGRLEALVHSLRLLGNETGVGAEALELRDVLEQSVELHRYHRDLRDVEVEIDASVRVMPVRIERRRAAHALLILLAAAASAASVRQQVVRVALSGDDSAVRLTLAAPGDDATSGIYSESLLEAAGALLESSGGAISLEQGALVLELPALGAVRQTERSAR